METLRDAHCSFVCSRNKHNKTKPITMSIDREWLMKHKIFTPRSTNELEIDIQNRINQRTKLQKTVKSLFT